MNAETSNNRALTSLTIGFLGLAGLLLFNLWGRPSAPVDIPPTPPEFTNTATVRMSAADLFRTDGDTSGFGCYTCHDAKKELVVRLDTNGTVILSEPHKEIVMRHGGNKRNDHCFICHNPKNLEQLLAHEGQPYKLTESSRLCGRGCPFPNPGKWDRGNCRTTRGFRQSLAAAHRGFGAAPGSSRRDS
jgi:hypothetical protein